jgi:hypothetical protein
MESKEILNLIYLQGQLNIARVQLIELYVRVLILFVGFFWLHSILSVSILVLVKETILCY